MVATVNGAEIDGGCRPFFSNFVTVQTSQLQAKSVTPEFDTWLSMLA